MRQFKGKAIYNPSGKAGEYSYWACNFYNGCSNGCEYCYCKKGILAKTMGGDKPTIKKMLVDSFVASKIFVQEVAENVEELRKHGLFFSFTTDPLLPETIELTLYAIGVCQANRIPVKVLTKMGNIEAHYFDSVANKHTWDKSLIAYGVTLTGHDELELNAPSNQSRIEALRLMKNAGFKTFASIEPIIDFKSSWKMVYDTTFCCDLYKIGLESGKKYDKTELRQFISFVTTRLENHSLARIYFKDSLLKQAGIERKDLPSVCVGRDYNLFGKEATE